MPESARWQRLCASAELPEGQARGFDPDGEGVDSVVLVRWRGAVYGWRNRCPHIDGAPMAWRRDAYMNAAQTHLACHGHGAWFEPDSGLCVQGPCVGRRLQPVSVREQAGAVYAVPSLP